MIRTTEEEYRLALEKWKKENPDKAYRDIPSKAVVEVNGKTINIGERIGRIKGGKVKLKSEDRKYWEERGVLTSKRITEEEYHLALEKWKRENPDKEYKDILTKTVVEINGKQVNIGIRINNIKSGRVKLKPEDRKYWEEKGILKRKKERPSEEEYQKALEIWEENNPDKEYRDIPSKIIIEVNGKTINLGGRITRMKKNPDILTEEEKKYWKERGVLEAKYLKDKDYQRALEKWKEEHPDQEYKDIPSNATVELDGRIVRLGAKISNMKNMLLLCQRK